MTFERHYEFLLIAAVTTVTRMSEHSDYPIDRNPDDQPRQAIDRFSMCR
jgi:hypothetical protein